MIIVFLLFLLLIFNINCFTTSQRGIDLITSFEGCELTAYWDQYGKVWIMNKALRCCKCVDSSYDLPAGWEYGRCLNFDAANQKKIHAEKRLHAIEQHKNDRLLMFRSMYKFFVDHNNDFELTAKQFNYSHTRNAFMTACRILLPEYKPLPNNRWKNRK